MNDKLESSDRLDQEIYFIRTQLNQANKILQELKDRNLLNNEIKITEFQNHLYIPVHVRGSNTELFRIIPFSDLIPGSELDFPIECRTKKRKQNLKESLIEEIPSQFHDLLPRSFDIIGDIAIIELNREEQEKIQPYKSQIAQKILDINKNLKTVLEKYGNVDGICRIRKFNHLAGESKTITLHKENNCKFALDISKVFFTPRLAFERSRISSIDSKFNTNGFIWDMFCGVGPFFIQIGKKFSNLKIIATDINPIAIEYANLNIEQNKLSNQNKCFTQDVSQMPLQIDSLNLQHNISRIIMNLPELNIEFLQYLPPFIHPEGTLLHIYQFNEKPNSLDEALKKITTSISNSPLFIDKILHSRIVKPFSPALDTTVVDLILKITEKN